MKTLIRSRDAASRGAALMIALALVVVLTGLALAYFSLTTTDRQLAQSSYTYTSADLLTRSALDIVVNDFKQEILTAGNDCKYVQHSATAIRRRLDPKLDQAQL